MSGCSHYMLRAQHMLDQWATSYMLSRGRSPVKGSAHASHVLRAGVHFHVPTRDPCWLSPIPTPHLTPLSQAQAIQTSYLLLIITLGPLCPGKGVGQGAGPSMHPHFFGG